MVNNSMSLVGLYEALPSADIDGSSQRSENKNTFLFKDDDNDVDCEFYKHNHISNNKK